MFARKLKKSDIGRYSSSVISDMEKVKYAMKVEIDPIITKIRKPLMLKIFLQLLTLRRRKILMPTERRVEMRNRSIEM